MGSLGDEYLDGGILESSCNIGRIDGGTIAGVVAYCAKHRRLQAAEGESVTVRAFAIELLEHRTRETKTPGLTFPGQPLDRCSSRITKTQQVGHFVECLARRIVQRLSQQAVLTPPRNVEQHGMAATH